MNYRKIIFILCLGIFLFTGRYANAQSLTFAYTGGMQTWTVPCNVTSVTIDCYGAQGVPKPNENHVGYGGEARGVLSVYPGQVYYIFVGGQAGWNGGGLGQLGANGGDGSDVRFGGVAISNRIIVAGGGGGSGGDSWSCLSGVTGNGGGGTAVGTNFVGGGGGLGYGGCGTNGGSVGGTGYAGNCHGGGAGGGGMTSGGGGATATCGPYTSANGALGLGGATYIAPLCTSSGEGVGGGGGGYYGGGAACGYNCGGGEGGGGSSWTGTLTSPYFNQGVWTGNGQVILTFNNVIIPVTDTAKLIANENTCNGLTGKAYAKATGVLLSYSWSPSGETTDTATGLSAGTYTISISNPCGNTASSTVTITQPVNVISATASTVTNVFCNGAHTGSATVTITGVGTPYTYTWTPSGETVGTATALAAGVYTVKVVNACGATASATTTITQPAALSITASTTANVLCYGGNNGSAASVTHSGVAPYTYAWSPSGGNLDTAVGVVAGVYTITLTDNNGCTGSARTTITQPNLLTVSASTINNVLCNAYKTGNASSTVAGGTSPYTYAWTGGETIAAASSLSAGTYTVSVTDLHGCSSSAQTTLTQPTAVSVIRNSTLDSGACTGSAWVVVTGGILPYSYLWSNGNNTYYIADQCGTHDYCCTITDGHGCVDTLCIPIYSVAGVANVTANSGRVLVYPNPTSGQFTVESSVTGGWLLEVYNVLGERVYSQSNIHNGTTNINLSSQPNGTYLYRVISTENGNLVGQGKVALEK